MKRVFLIWMALFLVGCGTVTEKGTAMEYRQITAQEAKEMMNRYEDAVILDVREQEEYEEGHIPEAILLPVGMIDEDTALGTIPEKNTVVLVYCRSGNRSKTASQTLAELGYTQVYEFGGIRDWPYEIEK